MPIDFDAIRQQFSLRGQLLRYGAKIKHDGRYSCVIPGHKDKNPSASYTRRNGVEHWRCHACDLGGDVIDLVAAVEGVSLGEAARRLAGDAPPMPRKAPPAPESEPEDLGLVFDLVPVPDDVPPLKGGAETPPILSKRGKITTATPADVYGYHNLDGSRAGYVLRVITPEGGKKHLPVRWDASRGWVWSGWSGEDRAPLYNAPAIVRRVDAPVLLVEGEKCAKLARALLTDYVVTCWLGGTAGVKRADFSLLAGREVTFWPDNDDGGRAAMKTAVAKASAARSWWIEPSADWAEGYDIADLLAEEGIEGARSFMEGREELRPKPEPGELPAGNGWLRIGQGGWLPDDAYIDRTKDGGITIRSELNAFTAAQHHPRFRAIGWDVIRRCVMDGDRVITAGADVRSLQVALAASTQVKLGVEAFGKLLVDIAMTRPVNPLADRLRALAWDGVQRLLAGYAGVRVTPWSIAAFDRWFLGVIARIFEPGCQHDLTLVLEGEQGPKKTSFLRTLASPVGFDGYTEMPHLSLGSNDLMHLDGKLIVELGEMVAYRKSDQETFKAALTSRVDRYRRPYASTFIDVPRTCIFAGTTNQLNGYLKDQTGNRRFVPVRCIEEAQLDELTEDLDQIYAQAIVRYTTLRKARAEVNWFTPAELELQREATGGREQTAVFAAEMESFLVKEINDWIDPTEFYSGIGLGSMRDRKVFQEQVEAEMLRRGWRYGRGSTRDDRAVRFWRLKAP